MYLHIKIFTEEKENHSSSAQHHCWTKTSRHFVISGNLKSTRTPLLIRLLNTGPTSCPEEPLFYSSSSHLSPSVLDLSGSSLVDTCISLSACNRSPEWTCSWWKTVPPPWQKGQQCLTSGFKTHTNALTAMASCYTLHWRPPVLFSVQCL